MNAWNACIGALLGILLVSCDARMAAAADGWSATERSALQSMHIDQLPAPPPTR